MEILRIKSRKRAIVNLLIMLGLGVFSIVCYKTKHMHDSADLGIIILSNAVFLDLFKNSQVASRKDKEIIINTIIYCFIFITIYQLILIIYKIDLQAVAKLLCVQILLLIFQCEKYFVDRIGGNGKKINYLLCIGAFIGVIIYETRKESNFLNIMLIVLAALVIGSLIYLIIIFIHNRSKSKLNC